MTDRSDSQRILIVQDDPACRTLLGDIFEQHGFQVTHIDSVLAASEVIAQVRPTVIVLDLALPYRSGASWLARLRAQPQTANVPVVILSSLSDVLPRERRELAQAFIRRPFQARALVETVQAVCAGILVADVDATADPASTRLQESP